MKKITAFLICTLVATSALGQLHTFEPGQRISSAKMNENFESLINSNVLRSTSVNCDDGETINAAIENGFNDIMVSGTCNENLNYTVWRDQASEDYRPSGKLAPRYLKISGTSVDSKIVDASSNTENTISVNSGTTLFLENITISGGKYGVAASRNSNLLISGVTVENFSMRGLQVDDSSFLGFNTGGLVLKGAMGADRAIHLATGSSG